METQADFNLSGYLCQPNRELFVNVLRFCQYLVGKIPNPGPDGEPFSEVRGYVPNLYQHFAACDLAVVQGWGTTTLELTALSRPFLYFPREQHFE